MKDIDALKHRFERIARTLPESLLRGEDDDDALTRDILADFKAAPVDRFLGFYAPQGMEAALEAYGIYDALRGKGYSDFQVEFDLQPFHHTLKLLADGLVVCECRVRQARGATDPCIAAFQLDFMPNLLVVEWLALQDPRAASDARPPLPGQDFPGSGVGDEVLLMLYLAARRLRMDGILEIPMRFHNAALYRHRTNFIDPAFDGQFGALLRLLERTSLVDLAWAMERGQVIDEATGQPIVWAPREQLLALSPKLARYFESPAWRRARSAASARYRPKINLREIPARKG